MGLPWLAFRLRYALRLRSGSLRRRLPAVAWSEIPPGHFLQDPSLAEAERYLAYRRDQAPAFFFNPTHQQLYRPYFTPWDEHSDAVVTPVARADQVASGVLRYFAHVADYLPYDLLRRKWQWHLLTMVRQTLPTEAVNQLVDACFTPYPNGLVTNVHKGTVPSQYQSVARYVAASVVRPPISVRRIDHYDGHQVTYHSRSHRTDRVERETIDVDTCIGRMIQHTLPKGFKRIRCYGVQATKTFAKIKGIIQAALAKVGEVVKGAVKIIARLTYRQRYEQSTGRDPFRCPHCQREMGLWRLWHSTYGVVYGEGQKIKRGIYPSSAQRAGP